MTNTTFSRYVACLTLGILVGFIVFSLSVAVKREFGWRYFLVHGNEMERRRLYNKLQTFWAFWKIDLASSLLILIMVWAFLSLDWSASMSIGVVCACISTVTCNGLMYYGVAAERRFVTKLSVLFGCFQVRTLCIPLPFLRF